MGFQLLTMRQGHNLDFLPPDHYDSWEELGDFDAFVKARDAANNSVKGFAPISWISLNQHTEIGCCTPIHHPRDDKFRQWFKILGVK